MLVYGLLGVLLACFIPQYMYTDDYRHCVSSTQLVHCYTETLYEPGSVFLVQNDDRSISTSCSCSTVPLSPPAGNDNDMVNIIQAVSPYVYIHCTLYVAYAHACFTVDISLINFLPSCINVQ